MIRFAMLSALFAFTVLTACEKEDPQPELTLSEQMEGTYAGAAFETNGSGSSSTRSGTLVATKLNDTQCSMAINFLLASDMDFTITLTDKNNFEVEPFDYGTLGRTYYGSGTLSDTGEIMINFTFDGVSAGYAFTYTGERE